MWLVWEQYNYAIERMRAEEAARVTLLRAAVASLFSKDSGEAFGKLVKTLSGGEDNGQ